MAKEWIAIYLGAGFVPGIPARDLTQAEVKRFGVSNLKKSGIYTLMETVEAKHGHESPDQSSSG
jgi:hypothetical protein